MTGPVVRVLVAFHSRRGHVETLAAEVAAAAGSVPGTEASLRHVSAVTRDELLGCDALVVGTPVHTGSMAAPVKQFFDDWHLRFDFYPDRPMRDRVGAAFAAGGQGDGGRELAMLGILSAMLHHHMLVVAGDSGIGASAATEGEAPGVAGADRERARALGRRVAEVAHRLRRGCDDQAGPLP
ncbi:MAG: flavodoxin family protein [Chromatiales bacterium]|jgi:NAD(P)H dehydrogenase (quinone)|nr:flavodoxin family protein [Chromatiales bacterium]